MEYKFKKGDTVQRIGCEFLPEMTYGSIWKVFGYDSEGMLQLEGFEESGNHLGWDENFFIRVVEQKEEDKVNSAKYNPLNVQQSGDHYNKRGIQPVEYGIANNLSFPQVNVVKYVTRHEDKNGIDDLAKSIHYHFFEALRVYGEDGSTQLRDKVLKLLNMEESQEDKKEDNK